MTQLEWVGVYAALTLLACLTGLLTAAPSFNHCGAHKVQIICRRFQMQLKRTKRTVARLRAVRQHASHAIAAFLDTCSKQENHKCARWLTGHNLGPVAKQKTRVTVTAATLCKACSQHVHSAGGAGRGAQHRRSTSPRPKLEATPNASC